MLNCVGHQFVHDERERHCDVSCDDNWIGIYDKRPRSVGTARRGCNPLTKFNEETVERHCSDVVISVKLLMDSSDGSDAGSSVVKLTCCGPCCLSLQMQKAGHDLQAVLDAVVDLLHQQVFLPSNFLKCTFCLLELLSLVKIAQRLKFLEQSRSHLAMARFRILQQHSGEFFMLAQKLFHVIFKGKFRVH